MSFRTMQMLAALTEAHEKNLNSGDKAVVDDSIRRWCVMCQYLKSSPRTFGYGVELERFGKALIDEREAASRLHTAKAGA